jgi:hypothetical protein
MLEGAHFEFAREQGHRDAGHEHDVALEEFSSRRE